MKGSLILSLTAALLVVMASASAADEPVSGATQTTEQVIEPQIDRRTVTVPHIRSSDIEATYYTGTLSIENFGSSPVTGARLAFHVTERLFIEGAMAESTVSDQFYRDRAQPIFDKQRVDLTYYNASLGYNVLPGESFITKNFAVASAFYLIAGIGTTQIAREKFSTFNFGFGYRVLWTDWLAMHLDVRDYVFNNDILSRSSASGSKNQRTDNFEMTVGLSAYF